MRTEALTHARRVKAEYRIVTRAADRLAVSAHGQWKLTDDLAVRDAVETVFAAFRERGTCGSVVRFFNSTGRRLPRGSAALAPGLT